MLLFIDESGHDHGEAPYEVLAGVAIRERDLWNLIQAIRALELEHFGVAMAEVGLEFKGRKLLKTKTFRHAGQGPEFSVEARRTLARSFLMKGFAQAADPAAPTPRRDEFTAYGQAAKAFVDSALKATARFGGRVFAAVVDPDAPCNYGDDFLRKDYAYLFERYYHYLESLPGEEMGLIVFDELEKTQSKILLNQLSRYFLETARGYQRSSRLVPEPFFVHSDLTTLIQIADIAAYSLNWGFRLRTMTKPTRAEMEPFGRLTYDLLFVGRKFDDHDREIPLYSIFYLNDLRSRRAQEWEGSESGH